MKFKKISENIEDLNIVDLTIRNRNVDNPDLLKHPKYYDEFTEPHKIKGMLDAVDFLLSRINEDARIGIVVDSDADGYTSGPILYHYLFNNFTKNLVYIVHSEKRHGITKDVLKTVDEENINLLIVPDAGSNDIEEAKLLKEKDVDLIVIDHHDVDTPIEHGYLINNQLCDYCNKNFTGAGMVYKFIQLMDKLSIKEQATTADFYLDLVAVGQIGDSSDISNPEIRYLVMEGLNNLNNKYLKNAINTDLGFNADITPRELSFSIIPVINAVTRVGDIETRQMLFEALADIEPERSFLVEKKVKNKSTGKFDKIMKEFSIYQMAYDLSKKAKSKQDSEVKKLLPIIEEDINLDLSVIIGFLDRKELKGISGLIANKLVNKYDKPALLLNYNEERTGFTGSGRGCEKVISNFKEWCANSGKFVFAKGHDNAFGVEILNEQVEPFKEYVKNNLEKIEEIIYEVDILTDRPSIDDCNLVYINRGLFGGEVKEPLVGLENMQVPKRLISNRGSVLNIYSWGVGLVRFNTSEDLLNEIENYPGDTVVFNIVGTYGMNNWGNKLSPQFIIKDIELVYHDKSNQYNNIDEDDELIF